MEIERFRRELDAILAVAQDLSQRQAQYGIAAGAQEAAGAPSSAQRPEPAAAPLQARDLNVSPGPPVGLAARSGEFGKRRQRAHAHGDDGGDGGYYDGWR